MLFALAGTTIGGDITLNLLGNHTHLHSLLIWGFIATGTLAAMAEASQRFGFSRISLPFMLGTMVASGRKKAYLFGYLMHFVAGWFFALVYAILFEELQMATWWLGGVMGLLHAFLVMTIGMRLLPYLHPRMADEHFGPTATRWLQPPGFLSLNYGRRTPLLAFVAHAIYGIILGGGYRIVGG